MKVRQCVVMKRCVQYEGLEQRQVASAEELKVEDGWTDCSLGPFSNVKDLFDRANTASLFSLFNHLLEKLVLWYLCISKNIEIQRVQACFSLWPEVLASLLGSCFYPTGGLTQETFTDRNVDVGRPKLTASNLFISWFRILLRSDLHHFSSLRRQSVTLLIATQTHSALTHLWYVCVSWVSSGRQIRGSRRSPGWPSAVDDCQLRKFRADLRQSAVNSSLPLGSTHSHVVWL